MSRSVSVLSFLSFYVMILTASSLILSADAKRGCNAFGHSCYGGHGKRSQPDAGQLEEALMGPAAPADLEGPLPDTIPIRGGGYMENQYGNKFKYDLHKLNMSPLLKSMLINYRLALQRQDTLRQFENMI